MAEAAFGAIDAVIRPTKFELAIKLETAKAFDLEVPPMLLALDGETIK